MRTPWRRVSADATPRGPATADGDTESEAIAALAVAEAEAAAAEARAEAARIRAGAARARATASRHPDGTDNVSSAEVELSCATDSLREDRADSGRDETRPRRRPKVPWSRLVVVAGALLSGALLAVTGLMAAHHKEINAQRLQDDEFVAAARRGVQALLSIDYSDARADVERVISSTTGAFRDDFADNADDFVNSAEEAEAVSQGMIQAAALEKRSGDTATVVVAAVSQVSNVAGAQQDPRAWRMSVTVSRDGETLKVSDVEFVP